MKSISASNAKQRLGEVLSTAVNEPVAIERHGKVIAVVVPPGMVARSEPAAERRLARLQQQAVERERLVRHQRIALNLLTLPRKESGALIAQARREVARWVDQQLCSADYVERWSELLALPVAELARGMVGECAGWGPALRQNSPFVDALP